MPPLSSDSIGHVFPQGLAPRAPKTQPYRPSKDSIANNYPPEAPAVFGRFQILSIVGHGGMGVVYEAYDPQIEQKVALKVLRQGLPDETKAIYRFFREAQSLAAIQHHRIVEIYDVGFENDMPYISMEILKGRDLESWIESGWVPTYPELLKLAIQTCEALERIHTEGVLHRDLKPANIWLRIPNRDVVLLDFGLARRLEGQNGLTRPSLMLGTPQYVSPENARGDEVDSRSDLFSLGVVLYELATGVKPFDAKAPLALMEQICRHHPARIRTINPSIPIPFSNLVMELLAKFPKDRPMSARVVLQRLKRMDPEELPTMFDSADESAEIEKLFEEPVLPIWMYPLMVLFTVWSIWVMVG